MRQKLIAKIDEETGMWIGGIAFLIAMIGGLLAFTVLPEIGSWIARVGIFFGLLGMVIHFVKNWRSIFHVDHK